LNRHVVIDVETTGFSPTKGDRIVEIAAVAVERGRIVNEFSSLISIGKPIPYHAQKVHGISDRMLVGQPSAQEVMPLFHEFAAGAVVVGHNVGFDVGFVRHELARLELFFPNQTICTLELSRRRYPGLPDHKLATVARHVLGELPMHGRLHRALDDARLTAQLWLQITHN